MNYLANSLVFSALYPKETAKELIQPTSVAQVFSQDHLLEIIFGFLPLGSAQHVCRVSLRFKKVWNERRYQGITASILKSEKYTETLQPLLLQFTGSPLQEDLPDQKISFIINVYDVAQKALKILPSSEKMSLLSSSVKEKKACLSLIARLSLLWTSHQSYTPTPSDLVENPSLLLKTLSRAQQLSDEALADEAPSEFWYRVSDLADHLPYC